MKLEIDLYFKSKKWLNCASSITQDSLEAVILEVLKAVDASKICQVLCLSLVFTSDVEMKKYNLRSRNKNLATNVLSFPTEDFVKGKLNKANRECLVLGEIIFSFETIKKESEEQNKNFQDHLLHLFVHSILHLLGYRHDKKKEQDEMENLETSILNKFGVRDPYE